MEEVARHHLKADYGEEGYVDAHTMRSNTDEFWVCGECAHDGLSKKLADDKADYHDGGGVADSLPQHVAHTVVELRAVVVAGYGLHALVETHDNHGKEE